MQQIPTVYWQSVTFSSELLMFAWRLPCSSIQRKPTIFVIYCVCVYVWQGRWKWHENQDYRRYRIYVITFVSYNSTLREESVCRRKFCVFLSKSVFFHKKSIIGQPQKFFRKISLKLKFFSAKYLWNYEPHFYDFAVQLNRRIFFLKHFLSLKYYLCL